MSRYLLLFFASLLGIVLLTTSLSVRAESVHAESAHATFSIPDVWPWAYETESGKQGGSLIELASRLSEISGIPISIKLRPLRRVILEITSGDVDFTFLFRSPELDEKAISVAKVMDLNLLLLAEASTDYPLDLRLLAMKRVAYIRGTYLGEAFEHDTDIIKVPVSSVAQAIELLRMGRIAAILASDHNILRTIEQQSLNLNRFRYEQHVQGQPAMMYRSVNGGDPEHGARFSRAMDAMVQSGELRQIFFGHLDQLLFPTLLSAQ